MRLLTGPAGSGKSASVLDAFRDALRAGDPTVRLLVPTATMAEHLHHRFAREGFVFRPSHIQTLSAFVNALTPDLVQVADTVLYLLVEDAAHRVDRTEFARVAGMNGFSASLSQTILEFASAGCDSAGLAACIPDAPLAAGFLAVYAEVDRELARRGLVLRARRLDEAAARIRRDGLPGISTIYLDGFHALPDPELRVLAALARRASVTLALDESAVDDRIRALATHVDRRVRSRPSPAVSIVCAPNIERECDEIARRILEQAAAGRPFREMGIIVRPAAAYVPLLRSTLERYGIPARFYFDSDLDREPAIRHLSTALDAMLGGWDHAATLAALRLAPGFENSRALDAFDHKLREQFPNAGLDSLRALASSDRLLAAIDRLAAIDGWRAESLDPAAWSERLSAWADSDAFAAACGEAALALDGRGPIALAEFWRAAKAVIRLTRLHPKDARRNVVNVLTAPEARQWVLPVVFVCGLVEKQFPQFHPQDPFFPDPARRALNADGIRVRTAAQFDQEERALFASAVTRATLSVVLTYPEFNARGDRNLPSLFLECFAIPPDPARSVRPAPRRLSAPPPSPELRAPRLLNFIAERTKRLSPSALENFLQCPFQYFAGRLLQLKPAPPRPNERLDFLTQGNIVHAVLAKWWTNRPDIAALFEEVFAAETIRRRIPTNYHSERARNAMLDDLRRFAAAAPPPAAETHIEKEFEYSLDGVIIKGKIDRLDVAPGGRATVIDYKYSNAQNTKAKLQNDNLLQPPLYLLAAIRTFGYAPEAMFYVGLKGGIEEAQWPTGEDWQPRAIARTESIVAEIRSGRIEIAPADPDKCRFCDAQDICRIETTAPVTIEVTA